MQDCLSGLYKQADPFLGNNRRHSLVSHENYVRIATFSLCFINRWTKDTAACFPRAVLCVSMSHGWHQISSTEEEWPTSGSSSGSSWSEVPARAKPGWLSKHQGHHHTTRQADSCCQSERNMGQKWHSCQNCNGKKRGLFWSSAECISVVTGERREGQT